MKIAKRLLWSLSVLVLSLSGCQRGEKGEGLKTPEFILEESATAVASEEEPQVVRGNTFEDFFYAFTMERPNENWQFLTGKKAAMINADSQMAMISSKSGAFVTVIAESMENTSLENYSDLIFAPDSILGLDGVAPTPGTLGTLPAIRKDTSAMVAGTPFRYKVALTQRGNFFYQILGWAMETNFATAKSEIEAVISSFRLVESREPRLQANLISTNASGFGWQTVDGIYSNAAHGYRIATPEGCRLMGQEEMLNFNPDASSGIVGGFSEFYQIWFVEHSSDVATLAEHQLSTMAEELRGDIGARVPVKIGSLDATEVTFENVTIGDVAFKYRMAWLEREGQLFRAMSWWQPENDEKARELLQRSYASVEWLNADERNEIANALKEQDPGNAVGIDYALRRNVFYDFAGGYQLKLPEGLFDTTTQAQQELEGGRLQFTNLKTSTFFEVTTDTIDLGQHAFHHEALTAEFKDSTSQLRSFAGLEFIVSRFSSTSGALPLSHILATNVARQHVFQLWLTRIGEGEYEFLDQELASVLEGFSRPRGLEPQTRASRRWTDYRLGFSLDIPPGWRFDDMPLGDAGAIGSGAVLSKGNASFGVVVMCSPLGVDLDLATQGMLGNMGIQFDGANEKNGTGTLAGLPATTKTIQGQLNNRPVTVYTWTSKHANTGYLSFIIDGESMGVAGANKLVTAVKRFD